MKMIKIDKILSVNMKRYLELSDIFGEKTVEERMLDLAKRLRVYRKKLGLTQLQLSDRSSVPYGTLKLFERTGRISLENLWYLAMALECDDQLDTLFSRPKITADEIRRGL